MEIYISSNFLDSKDLFDSIKILKKNGFVNIELTGGKKYEKDIFNRLNYLKKNIILTFFFIIIFQFQEKVLL